MSTLVRRIKRKQQLKFMKDFKKSMKKFKEMVCCTRCARPPADGELIDNWNIDQNGEKIDLICTDCYNGEFVDV